jgi:hypothetical protein
MEPSEGQTPTGATGDFGNPTEHDNNQQQAAETVQVGVIAPVVAEVPPKPIVAAPFVDESNQREVDFSQPMAMALTEDKAIPVVRVLSVKGVEYMMMSIALWMVSGSLAWLLLSLVNGITDFQLLAFPTAMLIVSLPCFGALYYRLRKAELQNPSLRLDPSKRRLSQITQFFAYVTCLFNLITFVYLLLGKIGGTSSIAVWKIFMNLIIVLAIAGGILVYYWFDEHRAVRE